MAEPRIIIVGGGFGGLAAAKALKKAPAEIILIDRTKIVSSPLRCSMPRGKSASKFEKDATRSVIFNQVEHENEADPNVRADLDTLDDSGINDLYHRTLREYARSIKRQAGVLV